MLLHVCVCQDPVYGKGKLADIQGLVLGMLDTFNYEQVKYFVVRVIMLSAVVVFNWKELQYYCSFSSIVLRMLKENFILKFTLSLFMNRMSLIFFVFIFPDFAIFSYYIHVILLFITYFSHFLYNRQHFCTIVVLFIKSVVESYIAKQTSSFGKII